MNEEIFKKLIKDHPYSFMLMAAPLSYPLNMIWHTFFVSKEKEKLHRWELWHDKSDEGQRWGHLYYNRFEPWLGNRKWIWDKHPRFPSILVRQIKGGENSHAHELVEKLSHLVHEYPHKYEYHFIPGPNSNTFTQWILKSLKLDDIKLPPKALGKNYLNKIWKQ